MPYRSPACRLDPVEPPRQTVRGSTDGAQPNCPAHGKLREDRPSALTYCDRRGRDRRFYSVAVPPKTSEAPEMEAHASALD